ncbi:MAG: sugar ABC transporter permease [Spirochaetes bacterium]|nr:sugar ABC transporter permease [Spirochaetota bacterium]
MRWRDRERFIFFSLLPVFLLLAVFVVLPIVFSLVISFFNYNPLSRHPPFTGLENYRNLFRDPVFLRSLANTFSFVGISVAINLVLATLIALSIDLVSRQGSRNLFRTVFFLPTAANIAAVAIVWSYMLDPRFGIVAAVLSTFGVNVQFNWLGDQNLVMASIITLNLWQDIGYNIIIVLAGLESIPRMFYESALLDGADRVRVFFRITLPLLARTMLFVSVMTIISYFQVFTPVMVLTRGGPNHASELIGVSIYLNAFQFSKLGYASTMAVTMMVLMMVLSLLQMRIFRANWEY